MRVHITTEQNRRRPKEHDRPDFVMEFGKQRVCCVTNLKPWVYTWSCLSSTARILACALTHSFQIQSSLRLNQTLRIPGFAADRAQRQGADDLRVWADAAAALQAATSRASGHHTTKRGAATDSSSTGRQRCAGSGHASVPCTHCHGRVVFRAGQQCAGIALGRCVTTVRCTHLSVPCSYPEIVVRRRA